MIRTALVVALLGNLAHAGELAGLAPADDARLSVAIGPGGQVYEPDGKGAWTRTQAFGVATGVATVARGTSGVIVSGDGAVYRLATNGWTAIRLAQKGKAIGSTGRRAIAALGRDVFDLDRATGTAGGEPVKTVMAQAVVTAIGGGVIATERGLARLDGGKLVALRDRATPISERWGIGERGAIDLRASKTVAWPAGATIAVADASPNGTLVAVTTRDELVTVSGDRVAHAPIPLDGKPGTPVGVVADRAGRVAVAFQDGRIAVRDHDAWTISTVEDRLPIAKPGAPPATSP